MKQRFFHLAVAITLIAVVAIAVRGFFRNQAEKTIPIKSMDSWQQADAPLGFPIEGTPAKFDSRFIQLTAFERSSIPTASQLSRPMGSRFGALTYNAQPFWSDNPQRGGHHSGDDINGIGGMNTDLGDPIYAIGNGLVVYRGEPSLGWGNTLLLAHRTPKGKIQLSMYAHMHQIHAAYGDLVYQGQTIGTVGTANLHYPAHLHFELIDSAGVHIGAGYASDPGDRINPCTTIAKSQGSASEHLFTAPLAAILRDQQNERSGSLLIQSNTPQPNSNQ